MFVVEQMKSPEGQPYRGVRQQFVKLGPARGDLVAVLDGVKAGEEVVTSGGFKLRNGAAVQVNNEIQPASDRARSRRIADEVHRPVHPATGAGDRRPATW